MIRGVVCIAALLVLGAPAHAGTLEQVKTRGQLKCGVSQGLAGFSNVDDRGSWTGLDVDFCRAVAAAVLGDAKKVVFSALSGKTRFVALQSGEVDLLARNSSWTLGRDAGQKLEFAAVNYFDGQGFMVRKDMGVVKPGDLDGATICVNQGTTTEQNIADYFRAHRMKYEIVTFEKSEEAVAAYEAERCDVYSTDVSGLYAQRTKLVDRASHIILADLISKEPLAPAVREGDDRWLNIVRWTHFAMVTAEELGLTKAGIAAQKDSSNPDIRRFVGVEGDLGAQLGLTPDWAAQIVAQVGNYGEIFETDVGAKSPLGITRGLNALPRNGGLQYAPPMR